MEGFGIREVNEMSGRKPAPSPFDQMHKSREQLRAEIDALAQERTEPGDTAAMFAARGVDPTEIAARAFAAQAALGTSYFSNVKEQSKHLFEKRA
jgi:hypothetical protein